MDWYDDVMFIPNIKKMRENDEKVFEREVWVGLELKIKRKSLLAIGVDEIGD
jgi:hypothetical protein